MIGSARAHVATANKILLPAANRLDWSLHHMFSPQHDFFIALNQARKAARRGDLATVERWLKCAEKHVTIAERLAKLSAPTASVTPSRSAPRR